MMTRMTRARQWISRTARHHIYAAGAAALFAAVTIRMFWFTPADLAVALDGEYGALCLGVPTFVAVAIGLQQFGQQRPQPPFQGSKDNRE